MSLSSPQTRGELSLLADPVLLAKRIAQLESAETQANEVIALVGPANEVLAIRAKVDQELVEAREAAEQIREEANIVLTAADAKAAEIVKTAEDEAKVILQTAANRDEDAARRQSDAQKNLAETEREQSRLRGLETTLTERQDALELATTELNQTQDSLLQEKAQLAIIREHMTNFLD